MTIAASTRPDLLVLVCGTGTEVGKTWVTAQIAMRLRERGITVALRKLAQSFAPDEELTDAQVLGASSGEDPEKVCPRHRWYETPMAPPIAAKILGRPSFTLDELLSELTWPTNAAIGLVETAGGVRSPQTDADDVIDIARALQPDLVLLVSDAGLGTINSTRLSLSALHPWPCLVVLNRYDDSNLVHTHNRDWLMMRDELDIACSITEIVDRFHL